MKRRCRRGLAAAVLALLPSATGCLTLTPVGPITQKMFPPLPAAENPAAPGGADAAARPLLPPGPPPPPPALLVTPGEVGAANPQDALRRLKAELAADEKALDAMPSYAEVSVVGGR